MGSLKIAILGLGESLSEFNKADFDLSIGVNDIYSRVDADFIVCVDMPDRFTPERMATIKRSTPLRFYTQLAAWKNQPNYYPIKLQDNYPDFTCQLDISPVPKSLCSPFVAAAIAYKYHDPKEIHMFGVDMRTHPHLKDRTADKIARHFRVLRDDLLIRGVGFVVHGDGILKNLNISIQ